MNLYLMFHGEKILVQFLCNHSSTATTEPIDKTGWSTKIVKCRPIIDTFRCALRVVRPYQSLQKFGGSGCFMGFVGAKVYLNQVSNKNMLPNVRAGHYFLNSCFCLYQIALKDIKISYGKRTCLFTNVFHLR